MYISRQQDADLESISVEYEVYVKRTAHNFLHVCITTTQTLPDCHTRAKNKQEEPNQMNETEIQYNTVLVCLSVFQGLQVTFEAKLESIYETQVSFSD